MGACSSAGDRSLKWLIRLFRPRPKPIKYTDNVVQLPRKDFRQPSRKEMDLCDFWFGPGQ